MWSLTQMKKNCRYYRDICCKFCKMCVKLKSFVVKNDTIFARNYWRKFLF